MSKYYNPRRSSNLYNPISRYPFRLSRSKVDLFLDCPRCFYLDRKLGVGRPPGYPFSLNSAVDALLKKEFDLHRSNQTAHPLMRAYGLKDVLPFAHAKMNEWRDALRGGVKVLDKKNNFLLTGGVDDIWQNKKGELMVVDYKATAKDGKVNIDADWQISYKRQIEFYQWLLRHNKFKVSNTGYFVYVNGKTDLEAFDGKLEFDVDLIPYEGDDSWVGGVIGEIHKCLSLDKIPAAAEDCDYCRYREAVKDVSDK